MRGRRSRSRPSPCTEVFLNLGFPVWESRRKDGARLTDLQHPWRRIREQAGLPDVRIHDFRHSYASGALALGEGLPMIGKLLGHTQLQTTARYAHLTNDPIKTAAGKVSDVFGDAMPSSS
ncbi:tyrosine-type recombinase/integrase [Rhodospirillum sp. A1_3_36]|uniref:tyrosine-type recombinase/integrase n=1 Tax=Rhodospirillum sp. A1_3_36 TaxID=3391666 RepID=UPI0039A610F0